MQTNSYNAEKAKRIARKEAEMVAKGRCLKCWHHEKTHCICSLIAPLEFEQNVVFHVYIHSSEFFNAGDDAKLLAIAAPSRASLYVHEKAGDDERLKLAIEAGGGASNAVILFPSEKAMDVNAYFDYRKMNQQQGTCNREAPLNIIVIDSTWRRARKMQHHLRRILGDVKHVKLETELVSIYARTQSQTGRICSVEAVALMLQEYGETKENCNKLIEYVKINNKALTHALCKKDLSRWKWDLKAAEKGEIAYGHPAWYFATRANGLKKEKW